MIGLHFGRMFRKLIWSPCTQCCQMVYFRTKNPISGKFWRVFAMEDVCILHIWSLVYSTSICYFLLQFGILLVIWVYIYFTFWYVVPRKIWQPRTNFRACCALKSVIISGRGQWLYLCDRYEKSATCTDTSFAQRNLRFDILKQSHHSNGLRNGPTAFKNSDSILELLGWQYINICKHCTACFYQKHQPSKGHFLGHACSSFLMDLRPPEEQAPDHRSEFWAMHRIIIADLFLSSETTTSILFCQAWIFWCTHFQARKQGDRGPMLWF
jgi:hypothetical protein